MSKPKNTFIDRSCDEIFHDEKYSSSYPQNVALLSAWVLAHFKGTNLKILNLGQTSSIADYFVIASAQNITQAKAMADTIIYQFHRLKRPIVSKEGLDQADWILIDSSDVIIHIFIESMRDIFDLDGLYRLSPQVEIPFHYYHSDEKDHIGLSSEL